jgi:ribosomal protein L31
MKNSYRFSFPSFIKGEFLTKLAKVNKKLAGMANANQVQILSETMEPKDILKPHAFEKVKETHHLKKDSRYKPGPDDYMQVVFSIVEVSLPIQTKINGFELAGTINIEGGVKTIFSLNDEVNLAEVDVELCHHCGTKRKRKALYVFTESSTGNHVAIGSTCVHDYIGLDIDSILRTFFNFYKEDDLYNSRGMREAWGFPTLNLANACRVAYALNPTYSKASFDNGYGFETNSNGTKWTTKERNTFVISSSVRQGELSSGQFLMLSTRQRKLGSRKPNLN